MGALVAIVAVVALIPLMRAEPPPPPPEPETHAYQVDFADPRHGFALSGACEVRCIRSLKVMDDGKNWKTRELPTAADQFTDGLSGEITVLGPRTLVLDLGFGDKHWFSDDAGESWREVSTRVTSTVPEIPAGGVLQSKCPPGFADNDCPQQLVVLRPDNGRRAGLQTEPPLDSVRPQPIPAADGTWWVSGNQPGTGRWSVAFSRDAGRSWTASVLPEFPGEPYGGITVTSGPGVYYATVVGPLEQAQNGLVAIFPSTDGQNWQRTWQPADGRRPRGIAGVLVVKPSGDIELVAETDGTVYTSNDGGLTLTPKRDERSLGWVQWTRAGYYASTHLLSPDGERWLALTIS
jgi:hypothetical protein